MLFIVTNDRSTASLLLMWGLAFMACGGAAGFLFGIPKILQASRPDADPSPLAPASGSATTQIPSIRPNVPNGTAYQQSVNTNLEQISDWLTKIIVGLGLANLKDTARGLSSTAGYIMAGQPGMKSLATATIIYFIIIGFLYGYLLTRLALQRAFARADQSAMDQRNFTGADQSVSGQRATGIRSKMKFAAEQLGTAEAQVAESGAETPNSDTQIGGAVGLVDARDVEGTQHY